MKHDIWPDGSEVAAYVRARGWTDLGDGHWGVPGEPGRSLRVTAPGVCASEFEFRVIAEVEGRSPRAVLLDVLLALVDMKEHDNAWRCAACVALVRLPADERFVHAPTCGCARARRAVGP